MTYTERLTTKNHHLIPEIVYQRSENSLSFTEVAEMLSIRSSDAYQLYALYLGIKAMGDFTWLDGLSNRAKNALIQSDYRYLDDLYKDVRNEKVDLIDLEMVGHKIDIEIRKWCINQKEHIMTKKDTTKKCPKCGDTHLVCIATQNMKICTNCFDDKGRPTKIPWFKEEGESDYI